MDMVFNPQVRAFIDMYAERRRHATENLLGLGNKYYFPLFEDILAKYDVPLELKFLPVIESALNPLATSPVGAGGLWQFMPSTGKLYGLQVTSLVDERRDPVKSTHAAARYLKDLHRIYNDWSLAIAAYNCGPGTVNRAIARSGGKRDFWSLYPYLPSETRGYVPIFIAATYVMSYYQNHNLCPVEIDLPMYTDTVIVKNKLSFGDVSAILHIPEEDLRVLNPQYRKGIVPEGYTICLPTHYASKFDEKANEIYELGQAKQQQYNAVPEEVYAPVHKKSVAQRKTHQVKRGETLSGIAQRYGVTTAQIKKWNGLRSNALKVGQRLTIK
jgi:membrane-bound lytic murein transglycosylase D